MACEISEGMDTVSSADLVVISTRLPRIRMASVMQQLSEVSKETPTVVVCHAGGEKTARALVSLGATHVIAEGNEATLRKLQPEAGPGTPPVGEDGLSREMREPDAEPLLSGFAYEIERVASGGRLHSRIDPITGLPTGAAFSLRFADHTQGESLPRVAFLRVTQAPTLYTSLEQQPLDMLRRRFVMQLQQILFDSQVEMFQLEPLEFAFIAPNMSHQDATTVCQRLVTAAESFAPIGNEPLRLAIGHAGPEVANEPRTLRELAERATLSTGDQGGVVSGDELALSEANSTEIDAMYAIVRHVDSTSHHDREHHERIAEICLAIGREVGVDGIDLIRLRLAARLHDIGEMALDDDDLGVDPEELSGEGLERYRSHPVVGAAYVELSTNEDVVSAIRHHHENWDGSGFPEGLEGDDIPFAARVIRVADFVERRFRAGDDDVTLCQALEEASGTQLDPGVTWAAITLLRADSMPIVSTPVDATV